MHTKPPSKKINELTPITNPGKLCIKIGESVNMDGYEDVLWNSALLSGVVKLGRTESSSTLSDMVKSTRAPFVRFGCLFSWRPANMFAKELQVVYKQTMA